MQNFIKRKISVWAKMIGGVKGAEKAPRRINAEKGAEKKFRCLSDTVMNERLYANSQLDRDSFAAYFGISRHTLNKILSSNTGGLSFPQWLNGIRIEKARELLRTETEKSIKEIANEVGLTPDNLRRLFRQKLGMTPTAYRRYE